MADCCSISVVVVNYNAGDCLALCVNSVLDQSQEIIIVDNASVDGSIAQCREKFVESPQVRFICNTGNLGFAAGCNIGLRASSGKYVLFLNPDCVAEKGALQTLREELDNSADTGMVGGLLLNPDGTEQAGGRRLMPRPWSSFVRGFGLRWLAKKYPQSFPDYDLHKQPLPHKPVAVEAISGACMMVRREQIATVGEWDEGYFLHCEDLDWCVRFTLAELKILFVPAARFHHELSVCSRERKIFVEWHKHKGMLRFYRKFYKNKYPCVLFIPIYIAVWMRFGMVAGLSLLRRAKSRLLGARHG